MGTYTRPSQPPSILDIDNVDWYTPQSAPGVSHVAASGALC